METWPNFFIVGAPKAGTTSLYKYLKNIPGIYMSPVKEPHYFSTNFPKISNRKPMHDKNTYLKLFENSKGAKIVGEASTNYLSDEKTPQLIYEVVPNAKIVIMLRDPIERTYSDYFHHFRYNLETLSFHKRINKLIKTKDQKNTHRYLRCSLYSQEIHRYLKKFGTQNVKVIISENLGIDPLKSLQEVLTFLGIEFERLNLQKEIQANKSIYPRYVIGRHFINFVRWIRKFDDYDSSKTLKELESNFFTHKKPKINDRDKILLNNYFKEDVKKLEDILGIPLPWSDQRKG